MNSKERAAKIISTLMKEYPEAKTALSHTNPLEMLVATILSAQCTDERVNRVTPALFKKYRSAGDYAATPPATLQQEIRSTGFYKNKAKNIIAATKAIAQTYKGVVPHTMDALVQLPGVGRKTASCVLGSAFGIAEGIVVDTHVMRLSQRLGLSKYSNPGKIEQDLMAVIPRNKWIICSHLLILHGRAVCQARKPRCYHCSLRTICPYTHKTPLP